MIHTELGPKLAQAADVLAREMMCIKAGESVLITTDTGSDMQAVQALQDAAYRLGAKVATITLAPGVPFQGSLADDCLPDHVKAATSACDVWIDLCMPYLAGSRAFDAAMKTKRTRYFLGADLGAEEMVRLFGKAKLDDVFELGNVFAEFVTASAGQECRMTDPLGTDVTFTIAKTEGFSFKKASKPGGYFVPGTVLFIPDLESVRGDVVTRLFFHEYYTECPELMTFKVKGKVQDVVGGGSENKVMRRSLKRAGNGDFGYVVHFTCGVHPAARYTGKCFIEDQRVMGNNAIGLGLPPWMEGGGETHPDCVVTGQSIWVDGQQIVKDGVIIGPSRVRELAAKVQPIYA
jgi:leucyl aminopeptidase (aminopeptidase T)